MKFYSSGTTFPLPLLPLHRSPPSPVSLFQISNVVITEQMNLLTPRLDLRDDDISDVRQCFTHVHEHVIVQIILHLWPYETWSNPDGS